MKINRKLTKAFDIAGWLLLIIAGILVIKLLIWEDNYYNTQDSAQRSKTISVLTSIESESEPSTEKPSDEEINRHTALDSTPMMLYIDRLDIKSRIMSTTADAGNKLPIPKNIYDTLWYGGSHKPGENGTTIISGLSGYAEQEGVFANLEVLEKGDEIVVEIGDHTKYYYDVAEIYLVGQSDVYSKLSIAQSKIDDTETLSLITAKSANSNSEYSSVVFIKAKLKNVKKVED